MLLLFVAPRLLTQSDVFPQTFTLRVRWWDLFFGTPGHRRECAVARALKRLFPGEEVSVSDIDCVIGNDDRVAAYRHSGAALIWNFDNRFFRTFWTPRTITFTRV